MTIEELQIIMQAMQALGDTGFYAFLAYLGVELLINLMGIGTFCLFIYFCYKGLMRLVIYTKTERAMEELRDLLNIGTPGPITPRELERTVARLKELASKA